MSYTIWGRGPALALLVVVALAGCGGGPGASRSLHGQSNPLPRDTLTLSAHEIGHYGGRFVIAATAAPRTFNATMANETNTRDVTNQLFTALVEYDNAAQEFYPQLAKSWEVSPDGLTWTWRLRRGACFSDGHPITSDDVLFSFEVAYDEKLHPSVQELLKVDNRRFEVSAPDSYTVVTRIPGPYALTVAAVGSLKIMPRHRLESAYRRGDYASAYGVGTPPESVVTSGAWRLERFVPDEKTVLVPNPYWLAVDREGQRLPYLDRLIFLIVPDQEAAALKMRAGDLDALDNLKPEDYRTFSDSARAGHYTFFDLGPSLTTNFFWFNLNRVRAAHPGRRIGEPEVERYKYAWFANPVFRRAVSKAVDRDAIISSCFFGEAGKNWSTMTAGNRRWFDPTITGYDYDPEGAKRLLAGLGWKDRNRDGFLEDTGGHTVSFTLETNSDSNLRKAMANLIADDLSKVGIRCIPTLVDMNTLVTNLREDFQYEALLAGLGSAVPPDPGMAQNVWRSRGLTHYWNIKQPRPENAVEAEMDRLMDRIVGSLDPAEQRQAWTALQKLVNEQCFFVWLPVLEVKVPVSDRFGNLQPVVIPHRILWNIDRVFARARGPRD